MPRVRQKASRSLKELCLQSISSNIDTVWCREFLEKYHGKAHYLFVLGRRKETDWHWVTRNLSAGPFDDLPPSLIHDVWTALKQRKFLRKHHCYLLISPYLKTLNLSNCEENLGLSLQLSQQRCYQLEGLDLSHNKLPKDLTLTSLPALTNLTSLSFSFSTVTNHQVVQNTVFNILNFSKHGLLLQETPYHFSEKFDRTAIASILSLIFFRPHFLTRIEAKSPDDALVRF